MERKSLEKTVLDLGKIKIISSPISWKRVLIELAISTALVCLAYEGCKYVNKPDRQIPPSYSTEKDKLKSYLP